MNKHKKLILSLLQKELEHLQWLAEYGKYHVPINRPVTRQKIKAAQEAIDWINS